MVETKKIGLTDVNNHLNGKYALICSGSFEERCCTVPLSINKAKLTSINLLYNQSMAKSKERERNIQKMENGLDEINFVYIDLTKPLSIVKRVVGLLDKLIEKEERKLLIDISTLTHETLLIIIKAVHRKKDSFKEIIVTYNGAKSYSVGDRPPYKWLSKGGKDVRNVIGYPGKLNITKPTRLIILTGFEIERATKLVEMFAPDSLTLGNGYEPTEIDHTSTMEYFQRRFRKWSKSFLSIPTSTFEFSCSDVEKTIASLDAIVSEKNENYVIAPLNTKLSTISVAITAIKEPSIQICYAIPEIYNYCKYSRPSRNVTLLDLLSLLNEASKPSR